MILMILLSLSRAWAGGVGATVAVGGDWFGGGYMVEDQVRVGELGSLARAALHWTVGPFIVGPVYQGTRRDYTVYRVDASDTVRGGFDLQGLGVVVGMPTWIETPAVRIGGRVDLLAELHSDTNLVIRPGAGLDLGVALTERRPGPELYLGGDASYRTGGIGLGFALLGGLRILGAD